MKVSLQYELALGFSALFTMALFVKDPSKVPFGLLCFAICLAIKAYVDKSSGMTDHILEEKLTRLSDELVDLRGQVSILRNRIDGQ